MSQTIFPLAVWQSGTNENSIPANDNALRVEVLMGPAISVADAEPVAPAESDQHVIGATWGGFSTNNVVIFKGGTWLEWEAFDGWLKVVAGVQSFYNGATWVAGGAGGGVPEAPQDGVLYGRKDGVWAPVTIPSAVSVVVLIAATSHDILASESGGYLRFTAATAKTCTFRPDAAHALPANAQFEIRNAGTGNLTLTPGAGVTLNSPYGGTLVVPPGGTIAVKRAAADVFDVMGVTA